MTAHQTPTPAQEKKEEERSRHEAGGAPGAPQARAPGDVPAWMRGRTAATSRAAGGANERRAPKETLHGRAALRAAEIRDAWNAWRWKKAAMWGAVALAASVALAVLAWLAYDGRFGVIPVFHPAPPVAEAPPAPPPAAPQVRRALDGVLVDVGADAADYAAVAIDNHPDALPQAGVAQATLVIEAPVEGGLTRLFAFFPSDTAVERIGPVRSARPYFVDWAQEYGAMFVHVGGSPDGLAKLRASDVRDLDEFFHGGDFWRDAKRRAPHSTFTSGEKLARPFAASPRTAPAIASWRYQDDPPLAERPEDAFEVTLGTTGHWRVRWRYDREANDYARVIATGPQRDSDGTPVRAKNVLVQFTSVEVVDKVGRVKLDVRSGGDARIVRDGRVIGGSWRKDGAAARTRFYDGAGNEVALNAGTTWIEVVPLGTPVSE